GMTRRPIEAEGRAPVVYDQRDIAGESQGLEPRVQIQGVIDEPIRAAGCSPRFAHADEVRGQAPPVWLEGRDNVAPEVGRGGVAVQEHDRWSVAGLDEGHRGVEKAGAAAGGTGGRRGRGGRWLRP